MFDKKYVLEQLYPMVCLKIHDKEKWIEFWIGEFDDDIGKDIKSIIDVTREIERYKDSIVRDFFTWMENMDKNDCKNKKEN